MLVSGFLGLVLATATLVSPAPLDLETRQAQTYPCTNGVFILNVRATDGASKDPNGIDPRYGAQGAGIFGINNALIKAAGNKSYNSSVPYSACSGQNYSAATTQGAIYTQNIIKQYADTCKTVGNMKPRIVLIAYSQGAEVVSLALMGGNLNGTDIPNLDDYKQYITGGAIFGDPSWQYQANYTINAGNATTSSYIPAPNYDYFNSTYGAKLRSYCIDGDKFCASGNSSRAQTIHLAEVPTYKVAATQFLTPLVKL